MKVFCSLIVEFVDFTGSSLMADTISVNFCSMIVEVDEFSGFYSIAGGEGDGIFMLLLAYGDDGYVWGGMNSLIDPDETEVDDPNALKVELGFEFRFRLGLCISLCYQYNDESLLN
ncbi:hypothetical protein L1887_23956 [Cichorium endivia]|nr:hypothetical protein L1887_23956 [Cichorium endivia]